MKNKSLNWPLYVPKFTCYSILPQTIKDILFSGLEDKTEAEALYSVLVPNDDMYGDDYGGLVDPDDDGLVDMDDEDYEGGDDYDYDDDDEQ